MSVGSASITLNMFDYDISNEVKYSQSILEELRKMHLRIDK
jgi:hypothetical protein